MSNSISFICDCCSREVLGCNIVNGMKFCAKCYQETFGETDKDKQIAELQKQLKSQSAEIVEKIRQLLGLKLEYKHNENVPILKICNQINEVLDTVLKEYQINR